MLHNGCTWRDLPHALPPWENVYDQFRRWRDDAAIECLHDVMRLQIVEKPQGQQGFSVLELRWVVERTFSWLGKCRRLCKDYETLPASTEAMIRLAMIRLMLRRLAH